MLPRRPLGGSPACRIFAPWRSGGFGRLVASLFVPSPALGWPATDPALPRSPPRLAASQCPNPLVPGAGIGAMGSAASRARGVPDPTGGPGPVLDQNWDALERLKHSRGALWTDEMASVVEHNLRHKWDLAPSPGESRSMWDIRVGATYDYRYSGMVQWLNKPLQEAQGPGQGQRERNPPNSEKLPEERGWHQPQERPWDHHGGGSRYQNGPGVVRPDGPGRGDRRTGERARTSRPMERGPMAAVGDPGAPGWSRGCRRPRARRPMGRLQEGPEWHPASPAVRLGKSALAERAGPRGRALPSATAGTKGPIMGATLVGGEVPHGDELRRLEVWQRACVQLPEFRLQGFLQAVQCAQGGRQVGAPTRPTYGQLRLWSHHQAALHRELTRMPGPNRAPGWRCRGV